MKISWFQFEQWFKKVLLSFVEKFFGSDEIPPDSVDLTTIKRILVIRQHDQLGDFLLCTPVFRALRQKFPNAFIAALVRNYTYQVTENNKYLDQVILFHEYGGNFSWRWAKEFFKQLRSGWDLTIVLNTISHSVTSDLLARFSRSRYILGPDHLPFIGTYRNFFYNLLVPYDETLIVSQSQKNMDIVRYLGIGSDDLSENMTLLPSELEDARQFLLANGVKAGDLLVGIHPGAGKLENRWPVEKFCELAKELNVRFHPKFVFSWGPDEEDLGQQLLQCTDLQVMTTEGMSLRQLAAVISHQNLFFCNDTGVMHLAAAVNTPLVVVFGPTDPVRWKPVGEKFVAVRSASEKCADVSVREVINAGERLLSGKI